MRVYNPQKRLIMMMIIIIIIMIIEDASRNRRPSRRSAADGLRESLQILCPGCAKNVLRKTLLRLGGTIDRTLFGKASATKTSRKNMPNPSQNQLKIIEKRVRRHLRRLKSTNEGPESIFVRSFCTFRPVRDYGLGLF